MHFIALNAHTNKIISVDIAKRKVSFLKIKSLQSSNWFLNSELNANILKKDARKHWMEMAMIFKFMKTLIANIERKIITRWRMNVDYAIKLKTVMIVNLYTFARKIFIIFFVKIMDLKKIIYLIEIDFLLNLLIKLIYLIWMQIS
jgi:hypothetical protein